MFQFKLVTIFLKMKGQGSEMKGQGSEMLNTL